MKGLFLFPLPPFLPPLVFCRWRTRFRDNFFLPRGNCCRIPYHSAWPQADWRRKGALLDAVVDSRALDTDDFDYRGQAQEFPYFVYGAHIVPSICFRGLIRSSCRGSLLSST